MVEHAFEALPVEMQEEGEGEVRIALAVGDNRIITIYSEGSFDTTYAEDGSDKESQLGFTITFEANIHTITP